MKVFTYILFFLALFYFMNYLMIFLFTGRKARKLKSVNIDHKTQETKTVKTTNRGGKTTYIKSHRRMDTFQLNAFGKDSMPHVQGFYTQACLPC